MLLDEPNYRKKLAENAYKTMIEEWNAENAANCFLEFANTLLDGRKGVYLKANGVCSKAEILKDDWYLNE